MIQIAPLGTEIILPAVVVGFELGLDDEQRLSEVSGIPDWFVILDQQAGGYCMSYPAVGGAVLRLSDNGDYLKGAATMIRGFKAMAEEPKIWTLRLRYPALRKLVHTQGAPYSCADLHRLNRFMAKFGRFPAIVSGIEAFVKFEPCDPLAVFGGWRALHVTVPADAFDHFKVPWFDAWTVKNLQFHTGDPFSESHLSLLQTVGRTIGKSQPEVFFLWENSD